MEHQRCAIYVHILSITAVYGPVILYSTTYNFTRSSTSIEIVRVLINGYYLCEYDKSPFALSKVGYISPMR